MKNTGLKTRIIVTLLPSLLPVLAIVAVTFFSARKESLRNGENFTRLVVQEGGGKLNNLAKSARSEFNKWMVEDVFGMSVEFETIKELNDQFETMLAATPEFASLVLATPDGKVIQAVGGSNATSVVGTTISEISLFKNATNSVHAFSKTSVLRKSGFNHDSTLIFGQVCHSSEGEVNSILLAYLNWDRVARALADVNQLLVDNGYSEAKTLLLESQSGHLLASTLDASKGNEFSHDQAAEWLKSPDNAGKVVPFDFAHGRDYVTFAPALNFSDAEGGLIPTNTLVSFLRESNVLASARSILQLSVILAIASGLVLIGLIWFASLQIARPIERVIGKLSEGASLTGEAALKVSVSSQSLADGASAQAASLEETGASLEEISSMTRRNAENAGHAKDLANQARTDADAGANDMAQMDNAMAEIKSASDNIAKIVKSIDEIAFQTNILALNAAVEAARAGEAGMGFAVVAEEVRSLAQRSAQAARETAEKIEDSINKSNRGVELGTKVSSGLAEIVTNTRKVDDLIAEIATSSHEQSQGITMVRDSMIKIDAVTQNAAATAEESAAASGELNSQAENLKEAVNELRRLVGQHKEIAESESSVVKGAEVQNTQRVTSRQAVRPPASRSPQYSHAGTNGQPAAVSHEGFEDF